MTRLPESQHIASAARAPGLHPVASPRISPLAFLEFSLIVLAADGAPLVWDSGDREAVVYLIGGACECRVTGPAGTLHGVLEGRASPFDGLPSAVFTPAGSRVELRSPSRGARLALFAAPPREPQMPREPRPPRLVGPSETTVRTVGRDAWTRRVTSVVDERIASRLLVGETLNPPGHWSSYPPHKHDTHRDGREAPMEEVYHYFVRPAGGFGLQMVYTAPDDPDPFEHIYRVRDGDTVVLPRGFHPVVAAGGYELCYLWAISGERVAYAAWSDDPAHAWLAEKPRASAGPAAAAGDSGGTARPMVAFDYDGTLVDAYGIKRESYWQAVAEVLGLGPEDRPVVDASYARTSGAHRFVQLADTAAALGRQVTDAQREEFSRRYSAHNEAAKDRMREFPAARGVLEALRARYDLVLTSGLPHEPLVADAGARGLAAYFVEIEGGDKGRTLDRLRAAGRVVVLFVGDTPHDESVATSRGLPFYRVQGDADLARLPEVLLPEVP